MREDNEKDVSKVGMVVLLVLISLYMLIVYFHFGEEKSQEPEGIIVHLILFFKLNFSNITPIL